MGSRAPWIAIVLSSIAAGGCIWKNECASGFVSEGERCVRAGATDGGARDTGSASDGPTPDVPPTPCMRDEDCPPAEHAIGQCVSSRCDYTCESATWLDCDVLPGCESELGSTQACSGCGHTCAWQCASGTCDDAVAVAAGGRHSCALLSSGAIYCWGANDFGQLGDGTNEQRLTPVRVSAIVDGVVIGAGADHTCALRPDRTVSCWGKNDRGQLGIGSTTAATTPQRATITDVDEISLGDAHTCSRMFFGDATVDSMITCWGDNSGHQTSSANDVFITSASSATFANYGHHLSAGGVHTCMLYGDGSSVQCSGLDVYGQLGDGDVVPATTFVMPVGLVDAVQVSAGGNHTCAVRATGGVTCWGRNDYGQVGRGTSDWTTAPVDVVSPGGPVSRVTAGGDHTCARLASGRVQCWGRNMLGQVGDGALEDRFMPVDVVGLSDAVDVDAGGNHSCAVRMSGEVWCWGANANGQCGDGTSTGRRPTPVRVVTP